MTPRQGSIAGLDTEFGSPESMHVHIDESEHELHVLADVPGFSEDDLDVEYGRDTLTIRGETANEDDGLHRSRSVSETIPIGQNVVVDDVTATYRNGVLEVTLPLEEERGDSGTNIPINSEG